MDVHVFHPLRRIQGRKDQPQAIGMLCRNPAAIVVFEQPLQAAMPNPSIMGIFCKL